MKIFITSLLLFSVNAIASPVARVIEVTGNAFVFTEGNSPKTLKYGSKIADMSEVMVEDGSLLSIVTDRGHIIYLTGGSLLKFANSVTELKNGQVWVKAEGDLSQGLAFTGNSIVNFTEGEFIYSFDNVNGKTQLLVLTGDAQFSNKIEPELKIKVPAGHFSFVEQKFEKSLPRTPTKVGLDSYKSFKKLFVGFKTIDGSSHDQLWGVPVSQKRAVASVNDQFTRTVKTPKQKIVVPGKITIIRSASRKRMPASAGPADYYNTFQKTNRTKSVKRVFKTVPVKYFGFSQKPKVSSSSRDRERVPASVRKMNFIKELSSPKNNFEKSLDQKIRKNPRHKSEVNSLIEDLKSYKQDYKKQY